MRDRTAITALIAVPVAAAWFDTVVMGNAAMYSVGFGDDSRISGVLTIGYVALASACLLVGWLGSRASSVVASLYAPVGGFLALLPWLYITLSPRTDDAAPPRGQIVQVIDDLWLRTHGPLDAVGVIGGAMLVAGLVAIVRTSRARRRRAESSGTSVAVARGVSNR